MNRITALIKKTGVRRQPSLPHEDPTGDHLKTERGLSAATESAAP